MKKILFAAATVAMLFATSCKNESVNEPETLREPNENEFLATIDQNANPQNAPSVSGGMSTKAYFNGNNVMWKNGDVITVDGNSTYTCSITSGSQAIFTGAAVTAGTHTAYYGCTANNLPATQTYDPQNNASHLPMYAQSSTNQLEFHNICGALKIYIPCDVDSIVVSNTTAAMNGAFTVNSNFAAVMTNTTPTAAEMRVKFDASANKLHAGDSVYIAVPAGNYSGLCFTLYDGANVAFTSGAKSAPVTIAANKIEPIYFYFGDCLPGKFSVSATKKVKFSKGNLQATKTAEGYSWGFASQQYESLRDVSGNNLLNNIQTGQKVDLFGWSSDKAGNNYGISTSTNNSDYSGNFKDWGQVIDNQGTWQTLSKSEWQYMIETRANASNLWSNADVTVNGLKCCVIAPDNYKGQIKSSYTANEWKKAQAFGLVCLPFTKSRRDGKSYLDPGDFAYWTSTIDATDINKEKAYTFNLNRGANKNYHEFNSWELHNAIGVRLVQDATTPN